MTAVGSKADRHAARDVVAAYHDACLAELVTHVAAAIDAFRAGQLTPFDVDEIIHRYHRAAQQLWTFCWSTGSGAQVEFAAGTIEHLADEDRPIDWWDRGASRRRWDGPAR